MTAYEINQAHAIREEEALRALFEPTHDLAVRKCLPALGPHAREFIRRSPFVCIGTQDGKGRADVSPRGDPAGFVQVLDARTLAIPDRPGNNRLDTLANILANPSVGLLFMIPGFDDTLRINGRATLTRDPALLDTMAVDNRRPKLAIIIDIAEVFFHCAKAFRRAGLWNPAHHQPRSDMPSLVKMILDDIGEPPVAEGEQRVKDAELEEDYRRTMY
ncbi:pyridoxamine 5'-phosphate oxidase family protein [Ciceribacter sp. L1K22]|uniref:pyridoxamine 5'-phosphate oxidase family protein n=1 Tax=Ciceribacter sp. L1K22 TaxID=2820275 RepID=UPI001ABE3AAF|nr:pyridoxamine 5'-phosphate oxidase family protein [Ciceribacter sp. L1K22]MBO3759351.1 pyridoxamine 5'-phosphate oxidase family protein [Ciceribacter sp. L1K22]